MAAAQRGEGAAFDALVRRYTKMMFRVAYRILGDPVDAEDAVQEAWVSAWRSLDRFRGEAAPPTWLYRVVTNAALAQVRSRRPTVPLDTTDEAVGWLVSDSGSDNPEGQAVRNEDAELVHRAIATLDPVQQVPLVLREFEGMSYEEMAEVLEVNVPALRSRLYRARVSLLTRLKEMRHE